jgi:hypothetical protein
VRPKDIGTVAETAVVRVLQRSGFPHAERRALRGAYDCGDVTGIPGVAVEIKGGKAAKRASDAQIEAWLDETEAERINARADIGLLVVQRAGVGAPNAHRWWAYTRTGAHGLVIANVASITVRMHLGDAITLLRRYGYGEPLEGVA